MAEHEPQADGVPNADPKKRPTTVPILDEAAPDEITGEATGTDKDLSTLFDSKSAAHIADGFKGGTDDDVDVAAVTKPETEPEID